MKCGVDSNIFSKYEFNDQAWGDPLKPGHNELWCYLAQICVAKANGGFSVKDKVTGRFTEVSSAKLAINKLTNEWAGMVTLKSGAKQVVTRKEMEEFVNTVCPILEQTVCIPFAEPFLVFNATKRLNTFVDTIKRPVEGNVVYLEEFLRMIRQALCAQEGEKTLEEMIDEINNPNGSKEFRFVIHWLAAIYQNPGINLQTNMWLVGRMKGIGKGTLMRVLAGMFGCLMGKASQSDMERGWNDFVEGKLIVEADEFKATSKVDFNALIKRDTTNPTISIAKRGVTPYVVPNITNWIFTTNDEEPIILEDDDRRNVMIKTTTDSAWRERSIRFNLWLDEDGNMMKVVTGFAALLNNVVVDKVLIQRAFETELRKDMRDSSKNAVEVWVETHMDNRFRGREMTPEELYADYFAPWAAVYYENTSIKSAKALGKALTALTGMDGMVSKRRANSGIRYTIAPVDIEYEGEVTTDWKANACRVGYDKVTDLNAIRRRLRD
jgi:hypothetical protein